MTLFLWIQGSFVAVLFLLGLIRPFIGLCTLLAWFAFTGKVGAHWNLQLGPIPLYVAEGYLAGAVVNALLHWNRMEIPFWRRWLLLYLNGLVSALRGIKAYSLMRVMRDIGLLYYSLFAWLTPFIIDRKERLRRFAAVMIVATVAKLIFDLVYFGTLVTIIETQPASISLHLAFLVLGSFFCMPLWYEKHKVWAIVLVAAFCQVILYKVRSTWVGFSVAFIFFLASHLYFRRPWQHALVSIGIVMGGIWLSTYIPKLDFRYMIGPAITVPGRQPAPGQRKPKVKKPSAVAHSAPAQTPLSDVQKTVIGPNTKSTTKADPAAARKPIPFPQAAVKEPFQKPPPHNANLEEVRSFFQGLNSPNVGTRVIFLVEITEILFSTRIPVLEEERRPLRLIAPSDRKRFEEIVGPLSFDEELPPGLTHTVATHPWIRALNGLGFGYIFVPERLWWRMYASRYDPHNSHFSYLYRMGLIGLLLYLSLCFSYVWMAVRFLRQTQNEEGRMAILTVMGLFLLHFVHTLTDVTLENSYKGIAYWVLLGLMVAIPKIYENSTGSDSKHSCLGS